MHFIGTSLEQLVQIGGAIWKYLFKYTNCSWFIIGSRRSTYPSYIHNFFHGGLGGRQYW